MSRQCLLPRTKIALPSMPRTPPHVGPSSMETSSMDASTRYDDSPWTYKRTASITTASEKRAPGRATLRSDVNVPPQSLHEKRWSGLREPWRPLGDDRVLPRRIVSRLPQLGQRTRRFFHATASYPAVYRIGTTEMACDLGFRALVTRTQLDAVHFRGGRGTRTHKPFRATVFKLCAQRSDS